MYGIREAQPGPCWRTLYDITWPAYRRWYLSEGVDARPTVTEAASALARHMPAGVRWNRPRGGMFVWLTLPAGVDAGELLPRAIERNVAFVPGAAFHAGEAAANTLRLAFVTVPAARIEQGVAVLGALFAEALEHAQAA